MSGISKSRMPARGIHGRKKNVLNAERLNYLFTASMDKITVKATDFQIKREEDQFNVEIEVPDLSLVSDGYQTIDELYDHRITLYVALCRCIESGISQNQQAIMGREDEHPMRPWRSKTHGDGKPAYEGWFIMGIGKEPGTQISYHIPISRWDETDFAETLDKAPEWDGHTSNDVLVRLKEL